MLHKLLFGAIRIPVRSILQDIPEDRIIPADQGQSAGQRFKISQALGFEGGCGYECVAGCVIAVDLIRINPACKTDMPGETFFRSAFFQPPEIRAAALGGNAGVIGAAALVPERT